MSVEPGGSIERIREALADPALKPMPEPCGNWLPMPGTDYVD